MPKLKFPPRKWVRYDLAASEKYFDDQTEYLSMAEHLAIVNEAHAEGFRLGYKTSEFDNKLIDGCKPQAERTKSNQGKG